MGPGSLLTISVKPRPSRHDWSTNGVLSCFLKTVYICFGFYLNVLVTCALVMEKLLFLFITFGDQFVCIYQEYSFVYSRKSSQKSMRGQMCMTR